MRCAKLAAAGARCRAVLRPRRFLLVLKLLFPHQPGALEKPRQQTLVIHGDPDARSRPTSVRSVQASLAQQETKTNSRLTRCAMDSERGERLSLGPCAPGLPAISSACALLIGASAKTIAKSALTSESCAQTQGIFRASCTSAT